MECTLVRQTCRSSHICNLLCNPIQSNPIGARCVPSFLCRKVCRRVAVAVAVTMPVSMAPKRRYLVCLSQLSSAGRFLTPQQFNNNAPNSVEQPPCASYRCVVLWVAGGWICAEHRVAMGPQPTFSAATNIAKKEGA